MAKPKVTEPKVKLPELLELDVAGKDEAVLLLERAADLKTKIGTDPDERKGKAGSGLLAEYAEVKVRLQSLMVEMGLEGLRHNKISYVARWQEGKKGLDTKLLVEALLTAGVGADVIASAMGSAMKQGEGYFVRTLEIEA